MDISVIPMIFFILPIGFLVFVLIWFIMFNNNRQIGSVSGGRSTNNTPSNGIVEGGNENLLTNRLYAVDLNPIVATDGPNKTISPGDWVFASPLATTPTVSNAASFLAATGITVAAGTAFMDLDNAAFALQPDGLLIIYEPSDPTGIWNVYAFASETPPTVQFDYINTIANPHTFSNFVPASFTFTNNNGPTHVYQSGTITIPTATTNLYIMVSNS
jgi:hypothetical protein